MERPRRAKIVANLPYNIATALLVAWLDVEPWPPWYDMLVLMFQREVAERIVATPGSKTMAGCRCWRGWRTQAQILFDVAPSAFVPPPKVTSSVVRLVPRQRRLPCDAGRCSGSPRRLRPAPQDAAAKPEIARRRTVCAARPPPAFEPTARAEEIPVEGFVALARCLCRAGARRHIGLRRSCA